MKKYSIKLFFALIAIFFFLYAFFLPTPTPDFMRNNSIGGVRLDAQVSTDKRAPIIKTIALNEYVTRSKKAKKQAEALVSGRVEGDIPCVHLTSDNNIYFTFTKRSIPAKLTEPPKIEILPQVTYEDTDKRQLIVRDSLKKDSKGNYYYPMKRYRAQYETYFVDYHLIRLYYQIDNINYISLMGTFMSNVPDDKTYFDTKPLDKPLPPTISTYE